MRSSVITSGSNGLAFDSEGRLQSQNIAIVGRGSAFRVRRLADVFTGRAK